MEVIAIEKSTLAEMKAELQELLAMTEKTVDKYSPIFKEEKWLDNQEVCLMMNISKRTLQEYLIDTIIPYIWIKGKILYKENAIKYIFEKNYSSINMFGIIKIT